MEIRTDLFCGDSKNELKKILDNSVDLIITSPPYADQRKGTYGGIHPNHYVNSIKRQSLLITTSILFRDYEL